MILSNLTVKVYYRLVLYINSLTKKNPMSLL